MDLRKRPLSCQGLQMLLVTHLALFVCIARSPSHDMVVVVVALQRRQSPVTHQSLGHFRLQRGTVVVR